MKLHELSNGKRGAKGRMRVGRGVGSKGKTSGRGHKGQKSRAGYTRKFGREGGQLPLYQKLPKRGFTRGRFIVPVFSINLDALNEMFADGETVSRETLMEKGVPLRRIKRIKIMGQGEISKKVSVEANLYTKSAKEKLEKAKVEFKTV
ncbi:MAG: 50S ribosomal protein L15 [Chlamydiia bacterium]|nr:50S ribosomal protein L15 [Chlamydiia bacterium]MCH9616566.1 50S ribosomal protein L15 [Chlamydiia bacterium]MCH9629296.1 50S ribosomal protein L15 [Chlamydiia bacterium]